MDYLYREAIAAEYQISPDRALAYLRDLPDDPVSPWDIFEFEGSYGSLASGMFLRSVEEGKQRFYLLYGYTQARKRTYNFESLQIEFERMGLVAAHTLTGPAFQCEYSRDDFPHIAAALPTDWDTWLFAYLLPFESVASPEALEKLDGLEQSLSEAFVEYWDAQGPYQPNEALCLMAELVHGLLNAADAGAFVRGLPSDVWEQKYTTMLARLPAPLETPTPSAAAVAAVSERIVANTDVLVSEITDWLTDPSTDDGAGSAVVRRALSLIEAFELVSQLTNSIEWGFEAREAEYGYYYDVEITGRSQVVAKVPLLGETPLDVYVVGSAMVRSNTMKVERYEIRSVSVELANDES